MDKRSSFSVFLSRRDKLKCCKCNQNIKKGDFAVSESEKGSALCFKCSPFRDLLFLPSGDAALTRRSKKHSSLSAIVQQWNNRRRRYERRGIFVEQNAIDIAKKECLADQEQRRIKNVKAAAKRELQDIEYIKQFSLKIREFYPSIPKGREEVIAKHACKKYSGRVGRTAAAKDFDGDIIERAVIAHIRHHETEYDNLFGQGRRKKDIREDIKPLINKILKKWKYN